MSRSVLLLLLLPAPLLAQPTRPLAGGFGGVSSDQFFRSNVNVAAGQLVAELSAVRTELAVAPAPPAVRLTAAKLSAQAVQQAQEIQKLARVGASREQLIAADQVVDRTVDALLDTIARGVSQTPGLADAVGRARFADQQLHAALGGGNGGADLQRVARLAAAVEDQAGDLRDRLREAGGDRTLDRAVRSFAGRVGRVRAAAEDNNAQQAQADYGQASAQWTQLAGPLATVGSRNPAVRTQAARTDALFRTLGERLDVNPGPIPPGPLPSGVIGRNLLVVGAGEGGGPRVKVFADATGQPAFDFFAYDPEFRGGVRVAVADLTGDGIPDVITAPGAGLPPLVRVFDGRTMRLRAEFLAYEAAWTGGVFVAAADRGRDGRAMIVTGADVGAGPHVKAFDAVAGRELDSFFPFDQGFRGGVRVAVGDVDGDGRPDILAAPGPGHEPRVRAFSAVNRQVIGDFLPFDRNWNGGLQLAAGDLSKNGRCEVMVGSDFGGPNRCRVFDPRRGRPMGEVNPYPTGFRGGIRVTCTDFDGDGVPDVVCAGGPDDRMPGQPICIFSGKDRSPLAQFTPFEPTFRGGAFVAGR